MLQMKADGRNATGLFPEKVIRKVSRERLDLFPRLQEGVRNTL